MLRHSLFLGFVLLSSCALAEPGSTPTIDGIINDSEWGQSLHEEGVFLDAESNGACPEKSEFWLSSDGEFIYFAVRMADANPRSIVATENRVNSSVEGNDFVALRIDPIGNFSEISVFRMNAAGGTDMYIGGGKAAKAEWLGQMETKGRVTDSGWEAEAKIPWNLMRLPASGEREVRFNVRRYMPRTQRLYEWKSEQGAAIKEIGRWNVTIPKRAEENTLKLLPYMYVGGGDRKPILNSGVDAKLNITDQIEAVGSLNPDFRNIENSVLSLDFSYGERLSGEVRPFFLEGQEYFQSGYDTRIFTSQRIASFDLGAKVFGRIDDDTSFGVMNLTTFQERNSLIASASRKLSPTSNMSFAYAGLKDGAVSNDALFATYGIDVGTNTYYAIGMVTADSQRKQGSVGSVGFFGNSKGFSKSVDITMISPNFSPRLGFVRFRDMLNIGVSANYLKSIEKGPVMEWELGAQGSYAEHANRDPFTQGAALSASLTMRDGLDFDFLYNPSKFEGFKDELYVFGIEKPRGDRYRSWSYTTRWGRLSDKRYTSHSVSTRYRLLPQLQTSFTGQWVSHFEDRRQLIFSANWDLSKNESISGRAVLFGDKANSYLSYRRSGGLGTEYFLIIGDPNADEFRTSVVLKVVMPFELKV